MAVFVAYSSGALASSQLRDTLECIADHQAVALLSLAVCRSSHYFSEDVEHLLTFYNSSNFLFHRRVRFLNVILILSRCQQDSVPVAAFKHVRMDLRGLSTCFF